MTNLLNEDWSILPDLVFIEIMMMINLESLHSCRQVCQNWNERIVSQIWEHPRWKKIIKTRLKECLESGFMPSREDISHVKLFGKCK